MATWITVIEVVKELGFEGSPFEVRRAVIWLRANNFVIDLANPDGKGRKRAVVSGPLTIDEKTRMKEYLSAPRMVRKRKKKPKKAVFPPANHLERAIELLGEASQKLEQAYKVIDRMREERELDFERIKQLEAIKLPVPTKAVNTCLSRYSG